jgi:hypothetical protein
MTTLKARRIAILAELYSARQARERAKERGDTETLVSCVEVIQVTYDELGQVEKTILALERKQL